MVRAASFEDPVQGLRLTQVEGRLLARGADLRLERLSARTPDGGSLSAHGRIALDPAAGLPSEIRIAGSRARLAAGGTATVVADLDLALRGTLLRRPQVEGRVDLPTFDVGIPDRLPAAIRPLPGARHVQPPDRVRAVRRSMRTWTSRSRPETGSSTGSAGLSASTASTSARMRAGAGPSKHRATSRTGCASACAPARSRRRTRCRSTSTWRAG